MTDQQATTIDQALATATDTRAVVLGPGCVSEAGRVFRETFGEQRALLVADENTWAAAGEQVRSALSGAGVEVEVAHVFAGRPTLYAGYENVEVVRETLRPLDGIAVSIASGTLNDLTKLASGELGRPYMNVCTAASMDGYAAFGASITRDGFKITRDCPAPAALVADLDVMAAAPARLAATGFGDLIEKIPGGADWIIADELGVEAIDTPVWKMVQGGLREALSDPEGCATGDQRAIARLSEGLLMSGLAMQAHQSSRPASGAGHNFSHQWEMEGHGLDWDPPLSHGNKVGIGTVAMCAFYEQVLAINPHDVDVEAAVRAWPDPDENDRRVSDLQPIPQIREAALAQSRAKYVAPDQIRARVELVLSRWDSMMDRVRPQLVTAAQAADMLRRVGGPYHPGMIGIDMDKMQLTYLQAQTIRSRYTILDTMQELGLLQPTIDKLFAPGGWWHENARP